MTTAKLPTPCENLLTALHMAKKALQEQQAEHDALVEQLLEVVRPIKPELVDKYLAVAESFATEAELLQTAALQLEQM